MGNIPADELSAEIYSSKSNNIWIDLGEEERRDENIENFALHTHTQKDACDKRFKWRI